MDSDRYIYHVELQDMTLEQIDLRLKDLVAVDQKVDQIQQFLVNNEEKNRFAIEEVKKKHLWAFWK